MDNLLLVKQLSGEIRQVATVIPLPLASVRQLPTVQFVAESVSSLPQNGCPVCRGIGVKFGVEYAHGRAYGRYESMGLGWRFDDWATRSSRGQCRRVTCPNGCIPNN